MTLIPAFLLAIVALIVGIFYPLVGYGIHGILILWVYIFQQAIQAGIPQASKDSNKKNLNSASKDLITLVIFLFFTGIIFIVISMIKTYYWGIFIGFIDLTVLFSFRLKFKNLLKETTVKEKITIRKLASLLTSYNNANSFIEGLKQLDSEIFSINKTIHTELSYVYMFSIIRAYRILELSVMTKLVEYSSYDTFKFLSVRFHESDYEKFFEITLERAKEYDDILNNGNPDTVIFTMAEAIAHHVYGKNYRDKIGFVSACAIWYGSMQIAIVKTLQIIIESVEIIDEDSSKEPSRTFFKDAKGGAQIKNDSLNRDDNVKRYVPIIWGLITIVSSIILVIIIPNLLTYIIGGILFVFGWVAIKTGIYASDKEIKELTEPGKISDKTKKNFMNWI